LPEFLVGFTDKSHYTKRSLFNPTQNKLFKVTNAHTMTVAYGLEWLGVTALFTEPDLYVRYKT